MFRSGLLFCTVSVTCFAADDAPSRFGHPEAAQQWAAQQRMVTARPDGLLICEAEEFRPQNAGWAAAAWGENYYAATFANSFLSRKAFLGAPEQCEQAIATIQVQIPHPGRYLALVRYEAVYRFETQFRLQIEQGGRRVLDRLYGARKNVKIWPFGEGLKNEVGWSWGAVENIVWEGHNAFVNLNAGPATITLLAGEQPQPAAHRNVDLVMLTTDLEQVRMRIEKEKYLPLDGMLTQSGDVWLRVTNLGREPLVFQGKKAPGGGNWRQHSPYWVHLRRWETPTLEVEPNKTSDWTEVGGTMDSLNDGQWQWTGNGKFRAEFALKRPDGKMEPLADFTGEGDLTLAADADTRYSKRLRKLDQVLYDLLDDLKRQRPAPHSRVPRRTTIYATTFEPLDEGRHAAAVAEFKALFGLSDTAADAVGGKGYIDVRSIKTERLEDYCRNLGPLANNIAVVSLGDEIRLPSPSGEAVAEDFRRWLQTQGQQPSVLDPAAGNDWSKIQLASDPATRETQPALFYWSQKYRYHYGIQQVKQRTDILRRYLPKARVGANYSPHYPQEHMFLGEVYKWVSVFRQDGMTLPWSEDYIWQVPIATPQMNHINFDLFRAANRGKPDRDILYYVMPHAPNNTPRMWRRLFYGALGHGMTIVDLFEFRPVHVAYTENHVDDPQMYAMVLRSFHELGLFEDIVQDGQVREAEVALWFSETADIWGDSRESFAAGKRTLYTAIRHQQIPLDFVVEQDVVKGGLSRFRVLYLTDAHVSAAASQKIAEWVRSGGRLFATAGAGMYNELNQPNAELRQLLGVEPLALDQPENSRVIWSKQDLPFAEPIDHVALTPQASAFTNDQYPDPRFQFPIFGARSRFKAAADCQTIYTFADGTPAVVHRAEGRGQVTYCGFLPGLSYYRPAIPRRPVDRGATEQAMIHLLPTQFEYAASALIAAPALDLDRPVECSERLVETTVLASPKGVVIPLINWTPGPISKLKVAVRIRTPSGSARLASGAPLTNETQKDPLVFTFDLDAADALILR